MLKNISPPEIEMVTVPAGEFTMGEGTEGQGRSSPAHTVHLDEYQIGRYPVTNAQYRLFMDDTGGSWPAENGEYPASGLTWKDAWLFCAWMRQKTGKPYHLPTEAEWEKAATWNPQTGRKQPFPWGDEPDTSLCNLRRSGHGGPTPVGTFSPQGDSPYGCADMIGNVDEWCNSVMFSYPYCASDGREEMFTPGRHGTRGGDWYTIVSIQGTRRNAPSSTWIGLWGFRVALGPVLEVAHDHFIEGIREHNAQIHMQTDTEFEQNSTAQHWYARGKHWLDLSNNFGLDLWADADSDITRAMDLIEATQATLGDEGLAWINYHRALVRTRLERYSEALADVNRELELNPSDAHTWMMRAQIWCKICDAEHANADWEKGIALEPRHPLRTVIKAQILILKEAFEEAIEVITHHMQTVYCTTLHQPEMYLWRGRTYEAIGEHEKAMSDYCCYLLWHPQAPETPELNSKIEAYRASQQ